MTFVAKDPALPWLAPFLCLALVSWAVGTSSLWLRIALIAAAVAIFVLSLRAILWRRRRAE